MIKLVDPEDDYYCIFNLEDIESITSYNDFKTEIRFNSDIPIYTPSGIPVDINYRCFNYYSGNKEVVEKLIYDQVYSQQLETML